MVSRHRGVDDRQHVRALSFHPFHAVMQQGMKKRDDSIGSLLLPSKKKFTTHPNDLLITDVK
jgi:hypothetical protein